MAQANVTNTLVVPAQSKVAPYFDDFDETKNFHRILFRPGYAVQARELTQLQTILQNQIERFGRHIFVNGSSVIGGKLDIADVITLNVQPEYANSFVDITSFKDKTIRLASGSSDVLARVIQTTTGTATNPPALHVKYLTGSEFAPGSIVSTTNGDVTASLVPTSNVSSNGVIAFLYDSIYFMQGYFVKVPAQATVLSKHDRVPTAKVGLELNERIITETADTSLLDPALESSNYQAPGASRYTLTLDLASRPIDSEDDEKFIQIAKIENGLIKERVTAPTYSEIEEVLARRTYDESGNYIVKPFILKLEESVVNPAENFVISISPGKAYLYGFETETQSELYFEVPKARDFSSRQDYDLNMNFGNYVLVDNLKGNFNLNGGIVDVHCVKADQVNTANIQLYSSTKIGTLRARDLEFFSGFSNTAQRTFELYFFDNKFTALSSNAGGLTVANNQIHLGNTANISTVDNAYTGSVIVINSGTASGDVREIISYNGATRVANVDINFSTGTDPTSNYSIKFDISDVDSFYQSSLYTAGATSNASATISLLSKDDGTYNGNTLVTEPNFLDGLYVYPINYVKEVTNASYVYRRVYNSVQFTNGISGVITASTGEEFEGSSSTSNTSSTVMDNWLVVVTNPLLSSRNVGDQVLVSTSITSSIPEQATLSTGNTSESFIATVYAKVNVSGAAAAPRVKTLVLANTKTFTSETAGATFANPTGSTTTIYPNSGQIVIYKPSGTEFESLFLSDAISAVKIYALTDAPTPGLNLATVGQDVTDRYNLDLGHRSAYYDHAAIRLKPGYANPKNYIVVCLRYYKSTNDIGYFSIDSYPLKDTLITEEGRNIGTGYSIIPKIKGIRLADSIDFRPVRPNLSNTEFFNFTSMRTPIATTDFRSDFSYYLERWDIVALTLDKKIERIQGVSSEKPSLPLEPERSLLLHKIRVKPYTETLADVRVATVNHRRYTMKDISNIDQRLKNVEYSVSLNSLEKKAEDIVIRDADGLDRTKYGILAESFKSHILGDVASPDYLCSIDINNRLIPQGGLMMPRLFRKEVTLDVKKDTSRNISVHDDKVLLSYTTVPAISQVTATKTTPAAEFLFADFRGNIICSPEGDIWKDETIINPKDTSLPPPNPTPSGGGGGGEYYYTYDPSTDIVSKVDKVLLLNNTDKYAGLGTYVYDPTTGKLLSDITGYKTDGSGNVVLTAGMTQTAFETYFTTALNNSGQLSYSVDLSRSDYSQILNTVYDSYFEFAGRPPEPAGVIGWVAQAIDKGWDQGQISVNIAAGVGFSGEAANWARGEYTYGLTPDVVISDRSFTTPGGINISYDSNIYAGVYGAGDAGGSDRDTTTSVQTPGDAIAGLYDAFFDRAPDPAGYEGWLGYWADNNYSTDAWTHIVDGFVNSAENAATNQFGSPY